MPVASIYKSQGKGETQLMKVRVVSSLVYFANQATRFLSCFLLFSVLFRLGSVNDLRLQLWRYQHQTMSNNISAVLNFYNNKKYIYKYVLILLEIAK